MLALISHTSFVWSKRSEGGDTNAPVVERENVFVGQVKISHAEGASHGTQFGLSLLSVLATLSF